MRAREWRRGLLIGMLLLAAGWLLSLISGLAEKAQVAVREAHEAQAQFEELEARKAALAADLAGLETARGRDAAIRTSFGVARPGEEVIVVVPPVPAVSTSTPSWWEQFLSWF